ncbi:MAG: DUF3800 domain-containing protein [Dongiaceae bacterium]
MTLQRVVPLGGVGIPPWSAASAPIWALVSGYPARIRGAKPLAVFQAYIDDSMSHEGQKKLVLAGYINTAECWASFSDAWQWELRQSPAIAYLKMSEANYLTGEFSGWRPSERDNKIQRLAKVIRDSKPASIHSSVSSVDVNNIIKPVAPYGFSSPYFYCFQAIMIPLAIHQSKMGDEVRVPIEFIFDEQGGLGDEARALYKMIRSDLSQELQGLLSVEPIFRDDKLVMPLQAADVLAWNIRRHCQSGDPERFMIPDYLADGGPHMAIDYTPQDLQRFADGFVGVPGAKDLADKTKWKKNMRELDRLLAAGFIPPRGTRWKNALYHFRERLARFINF